jgi:very-short-patch-repair endonuclease
MIVLYLFIVIVIILYIVLFIVIVMQKPELLWRLSWRLLWRFMWRLVPMGRVKILKFYGHTNGNKYLLENRKKCLEFSKNNKNENKVDEILKENCKLNFNRQRIFANRIFDFWNFNNRIVIEIDGNDHNKKEDSVVDDQLWNYNIPVFRIKNNDICRLYYLINILNSKKKITKSYRKRLIKENNISRIEYFKLINWV